MQQHYELLAILPGNKTDEEVGPLVEKLHEFIKARGATIVKTDFWGKRRLAYQIDHLTHGFYDLVEFDMDTMQLNTLERDLKLETDIIRHQIVIRKVLTPEQQQAIDALRERIAAKREAQKEQAVAVATQATAAAEAAAVEPKEVKEPEAAPVAEAPAEVPAEPVSGEQLDKKLEEILDADSIDV